MIRGLALTASFVLLGGAPALAQGHPPHAPGHPHGAHPPMDPARHAAMHALLLGSWAGTLSSAQGVTSALGLSVTQDSAQNVVATMRTDTPARAGAATNFVMDGDKLEWAQDLSGASCQANAVLTAATPRVPETIKGTMKCEDGAATFTLRKKTG